MIVIAVVYLPHLFRLPYLYWSRHGRDLESASTRPPTGPGPAAAASWDRWSTSTPEG